MKRCRWQVEEFYADGKSMIRTAKFERADAEDMAKKLSASLRAYGPPNTHAIVVDLDTGETVATFPSRAASR